MNKKQIQRSEKLKQLLSERILVLDGAMGTSIQKLDLKDEDFGGANLEGCNENLIMTQPDTIQKIHEEFLEAGADIIETNTFGATALVLDEYQIGSQAREINLKAAQIARKAADAYDSENEPRFVAGSMGPTTKAMTVTGGITFDELVEQFYEQALALIEGGVDYLLLETCQDTLNTKAGLVGIQKASEQLGFEIPIAVSITIEPTGTMLAGQTVEALAASLAHLDLLYIGLNCATGPSFMTDHIRSLADFTESRVACVPNAGLPDEEGRYLETPEMVAKVVKSFAEQRWINLVGGCCGTTPEHIRALKQAIAGMEARVATKNTRHFLSGIEYLEITDEMRPLVVGERTNVIGSRKFKRLITENKNDEAIEVARAQVKKGAQIIDICMANPDRDELEDMKNFLEQVIKVIKAPLMIDSTDEEVIELALKYSQGKAIINSINLEDGEERFEKVVPMGHKMGAAFVVGTIDEDPQQGMGVTRERKLEIAERSYDLLVNKYKVRPEDIYFDALVFPVGTGDEQYVGSAVETIEGIRLIKEKLPRVKTVLGVSNVSFGLPPAGREVLNSVFLYHCVQAGLDLAIVNSEMMERYASIPKKEIQLTEDLLWNRGDDPLTIFTAHFRGRKVEKKVGAKKLPLKERLANYIIEGSKDGLYADLDLVLQELRPLEVINGPLMAGMDEVGRLFGKNELIVAEVLQSAEAMKAAVAKLEPLMDSDETASKGTLLLATVKGDVHDIGKNLVEIILGNNGFNIINLGIKIPPQQIIEAVKKHNPDLIGLSGLLVKSAQQMIVTANDLRTAGIKVPILVGGAALSERFTDLKIAPSYEGHVVYAKDAMGGLELADTLMDREKLKLLEKVMLQRRVTLNQKLDESKKENSKQVSRVQVSVLDKVPSPPDYDRHMISNTPLEQIWTYMNPLMLYNRHLGIKGKLVKLLSQKNFDQLRKEEGGPKAIEIYEAIEELKGEFKESAFQAKAVYQFFKADKKDEQIFLYSPKDSQLEATFQFPRQDKNEGLCLADYVLDKSQDAARDNLALFAVTASAGNKIRALAEELKEKGDYLKSHALQALGLETAEAYAEYIHERIRAFWGFTDPLDMKMLQRFQAKYHGKRYSFGYPACPDLEDQKVLFDLLKPEEIGIELTDGCMMEPEASVSAIVFHHPEAKYFSVGEGID